MYVRIYYFGGLHNGKVHLNEQNGLWYELQGDYYSLFGVAHRKRRTSYRLRDIRQHKKVFYTNFLTSGKLQTHLADVEKQAHKLFNRLIKQRAETS